MSRTHKTDPTFVRVARARGRRPSRPETKRHFHEHDDGVCYRPNSGCPYIFLDNDLTVEDRRHLHKAYRAQVREAIAHEDYDRIEPRERRWWW